MKVFLRRAHAATALFWVALWIFAWITGLIHSVTFVAHLSIIALILASVGAYQGSRAEDTADNDSSEEGD